MASKPFDFLTPEKLLEAGASAGFDYVISRAHLPFRCGYVVVPPGHPWYGKSYNRVNSLIHPGLPHGGLTYSGPAPDGRWWFGFDCGHCYDLIDPDLPDPPADPGGADDSGTTRLVSFRSEYSRIENKLLTAARDGSPAAREILATMAAQGVFIVPPPDGDLTPRIRSLEYVREQCQTLCARAAAALGTGSGTSPPCS